MGFTGELGGGGVHGVRRRPLWVLGVLGLGSVSVRVERGGWERLLAKQMERGRAQQEMGTVVEQLGACGVAVACSPSGSNGRSGAQRGGLGRRSGDGTGRAACSSWKAMNGCTCADGGMHRSKRSATG